MSYDPMLVFNTDPDAELRYRPASTVDVVTGRATPLSKCLPGSASKSRGIGTDEFVSFASNPEVWNRLRQATDDEIASGRARRLSDWQNGGTR
jgi:hypothetical protein